MNKKRISVVLLLVFIICFVFGGSLVTASSRRGNSKTKPLDLVIVFDKSGSMKDSDPKHLTSAAVSMLINMMPAEDSRVGVIAFNTEPEVLTTVGGRAALVPLQDIRNVQSIKSSVKSVQYAGDTGIGNALLAATKLLAEQSDDNRQKAIILFTDGVNDFGKDERGLALCEENEVSATLWAKNNNCLVYCFGYDYKLKSGASSMGINGEGLKKLTSISNITGGNVTRIADINTVQEEFIKMLADLCDLIYVNVGTVPGDGGKHEVTFEVNPSVIEADIRIGSITENAINNGKIALFDPTGKQIELANKDNVRFDVDSLAASIKIIRPELGTWTLVLDGIVGDDVKIGLLQHYRIDIDASITLPTSNPQGVAYLNDEVKLSAWFIEDDSKINDKNLYNVVTKATATYVPRANPQNVKTIDLDKGDLCFTGSFVIDEECIYDVTIRLESGSFYRECHMIIESSNQPLELVSDIGTVELNVGKSATVEDIYSHVRDLEGDSIVAEVSLVGNTDAVVVSIDGNNINVQAKTWKSTFATVKYTDAQGNTVETTFDIRVHNPWFFIGSGIFIALVVIVFLIFAAVAYKASLKIKGYAAVISLKKIDLSSDDVIENIYSNDLLDDEDFDEDSISDDSFNCKINLFGMFGKNKNMFVIARKFAEEYEEYLRNNNPEIEDERDNPITECINSCFTGMKDYSVIGTPGGLKGFVIKIPKKSSVYISGYKNKKEKLKVGPNPKKITFIYEVNDEDNDSRQAFEFVFRYSRK